MPITHPQVSSLGFFRTMCPSMSNSRRQERVVVFIDGFNLYHAMEKSYKCRRLKWCDLKALSSLFCSANQKIVKVLYFSAYCTWNKQKEERHKKYIKFLREFGVDTILGNYTKVSKRYFKRVNKVVKVVPPFSLFFKFLWPKCLTYQTHEEKQTDVNIAVKIVEMGLLNEYDHAIIISGDSDLISAIKTVKRHCPEKQFTSILPPRAKGKMIQKVCNFRHQITHQHLRDSQLPDEIMLEGEVLKKPSEYDFSND